MIAIITAKGDYSHCVPTELTSNNEDEIVSCVARNFPGNGAL